MVKYIVGVLAKPKERAVRYALEYNSFKDFYPMLECDCFDIVRRKFGKHYYDIYLDDEGLLQNKDVAIVTFDDNDNPVEMLVGNCFICKHDKKGNTISLTEKEVSEVLSCIGLTGVMCCGL